MTLHQLRVFETVARLLNVTTAARELHLTQPTVSLQLRMLEEEFSARFFERSNHGVELTNQGRFFLEGVRSVLSEIDRLETDFRTQGQVGKSDSLVIGGNNTLTETLLPPALIEFKTRHPNVSLAVHTADSPTMEAYVLKAKVDVALITIPSYAPNCVYELLEEYPVVAFTHVGSTITQSSITLDELVNQPLLVQRGSASIKEIIRRGFKLNLALECDSPETVKTAARSGLGLGILFRARLEHNQTGLRIIEIPELQSITRKAYIICDQRRPLSPLAREFLDTLRRIGGITKRSSTEVS